MTMNYHFEINTDLKGISIKNKPGKHTTLSPFKTNHRRKNPASNRKQERVSLSIA